MPLSGGARFGPYEIRASIGIGGMGEVYRATDTKLGRDVAIKVLHESFAHNPDRMARFAREAQILASLSHPHIAVIHGMEDRGLVMELVEGPALAERIADGPLPLEEALRIAHQIADALEYAHSRGVIHRDLKPANIKITPDGRVKLLDFGLAKALSSEPASNDPAASPTRTILDATIGGEILGTAAYMSPEQVRGQEVDKRADIWAFGVVLYEAVTGKQLFAGKTVSDILAEVLKTQPDLSAAPPKLRRLLESCLEKDPKKRMRDIGDWELLLGEAPDRAAPRQADRRQAGSPMRLAWIAAAILAIVAGGTLWLLKQRAPRETVRLAINLPPGQRLASLNQPAVTISPDGRNLVYVAVAATSQGQPAVQQLYVRPLDSDESKPISGTEGASCPFFSPDGQWIGFFAGGNLKKVSVNGGAAVTLAVTRGPGGASWSSDGRLAVQLRTTGQDGLQQIPEQGGAPQPLTRIGKAEFIHRWPEFLPGGQSLLFAGSATGNTWNLGHIRAEKVGKGVHQGLSPSASPNLARGSQPRYAPTGHLLYAESGTLMAAPFDAKRLTLTGAAVPAIEGVLQFNTSGAAQYNFSSTGTLVYVAGGLVTGQSRLVWVNRKGEEQPLAAAPRNYSSPRVSPDGRRVAVLIVEEEEQTWLYDIAKDTLTRLAFEGNVNNTPAWSADGKRVVFSSNRTSVASNVYWQASDGSGAAERLTTSEYVNFPNSFSPDGQLLAYVLVTPETGSDIWILRMSDRKTIPFLQAAYEESAPRFSPDGRWIAYISDESGRREVYVQPYPGPGGKRQISTGGGQDPIWNPKGSELFYRSRGRVIAVDVDTTSGFSAGKSRVLFDGSYLGGYDVSPDGQRFLMLKPVESQTSAITQIRVVLNWFEELKRKVK